MIIITTTISLIIYHYRLNFIYLHRIIIIIITITTIIMRLSCDYRYHCLYHYPHHHNRRHYLHRDHPRHRCSFSGIVNAIHEYLADKDISLVYSRFIALQESDDIHTYLESIKKSNARIIIAHMFEDAARKVICEAIKEV